MARDVQGAGFKLVEFPTKTGEFSYSVQVPQADSWKVYFEFWKAQGHNPDEVLTDILNAQNKQTGTQSPKQTVRDAVQEAEAAGEEISGDNPRIAEAVEKAREASAGYVLGAPRAGGGGGARHETGLTKKQREEFGTAMASAMIEKGGAVTKTDQREIAEALGIDPEALNL